MAPRPVGNNRVMAAPFTTSRRIEFRDTDAAGIMHFSVYFTYMEAAEHEFLRHLGFSVVQEDDDGEISWPRVNATCDFQSAARFEDEIEIEVSVARVGTKSVAYGFRFNCDGRVLATGSLTAVCCRMSPSDPPRSIEIPRSIRQLLVGATNDG